MNGNRILLTDSYKVTHARQYPPGTQHVYSYFESRGGEFPETVFFGLRYLLERYLRGRVVTQDDVEIAEALFKKHFGNGGLFNRAGWQHIIGAHHGRLPVSIKAVAEGSVVQGRNVLLTVENTDPECWWLTSYIETLLVQLWYPCTVATVSRAMKQTLLSALKKSGDSSLIDFKLHDFGCRGSTSMESAAIGGAAHLVNFKGTDTVPALELLADYYGAPCAGFSIPAAEHSTITSWGEEHELDAYRNMLEQFPSGLVAVVSDSFNVYNACEHLWGRDLRDKVLERDGCVVVRPDSGKPEIVVPMVLHALERRFGVTTNAKGYKVLDPHVRVIQGDGINRHNLQDILASVMNAGYSADNIAFGCGGGLLQDVNRDTCEFAFKCSSVVVNGESRDVYKQPIDARVSKASKRGRLKLVRGGNGKYETAHPDGADDRPDELELVFENGVVMRADDFEVIRRRAAAGLD